MFKAKALAGDGRTLLILGLTEGNIDRLKQGDPIIFDTATMHIAPGETVGRVYIFYGKDEDSIARGVKSLIGPQTKVYTIHKGPDQPV